MIEIQKFDTEQKIAESNRLIRNMFDSTFTKRQMDLIYAIISLVKPEDDEFKTYHISYKAIGEIFNPSNPDCTVTIKDIDKAVKGIVNKAFRMEDDKKIKYYQYVHDAEIDKEEKYIEFTLSKKVQEFYLQLQKGEYTSFLLKDILALSTNFQINLFRWLACNAGFKNTVKINIEDAKLHFYGKEVVTSRLIEKLDSALKAINERTNTSKAEIEKIDNQIKAKKEELERQKARYTEQELYDLCYKQVGNEVYLTDFFEDLVKKEIVNSIIDNEGKPTELLKDLYKNFIRKEYNMQNLDSIIHKEQIEKYERLLKEYGISEQVIEQRLSR